MTTPNAPSIPDDTYEELLEATFAALYEHGYVDLRVRDIDAEFPKSRQLIHHYFAGKDALVTEILAYLVDHFAAEVDREPSTDAAAELDEAIDRILLGPTEGDDDFWPLATALYEIMAQSHHNPDHQDLINRLTDQFIDHLDAIMRTGIEQGVFEDVDTAELATDIDDLITGAQAKKIFLGRDDAPERTRATIDRLIDSRLRPTDAAADR